MNTNPVNSAESARNSLAEISASVGRRGGLADFESAADRAAKVQAVYVDAREKIGMVMNAAAVNTIDPALKRVLILNESVSDFALRVLPLRLFSTVFEKVPLQGSDSVAVSYFNLQKNASQTFTDGDGTGGTGYQFGQNTATGSRLIAVNQRMYQPLDYSSNDFRRQPWFDAVKLGNMNAQKLAVDILNTILKVFTPANYPTLGQTDPAFNPNLNLPAAGYDSNQIVDLETVADNLNWENEGRCLITGTTLKNILAKDPTYKLALNIGTTSVVQNGKFPKLSGFDYAWIPNLPNNGVNLIGLIAFANALAAAFAPIDPAAGVRQQLAGYEIASDAATGISMNWRHWGNAQADRDFEVIESAFGFQPVNAQGAQLLTHP